MAQKWNRDQRRAVSSFNHTVPWMGLVVGAILGMFFGWLVTFILTSLAAFIVCGGIDAIGCPGNQVPFYFTGCWVIGIIIGGIVGQVIIGSLLNVCVTTFD